MREAEQPNSQRVRHPPHPFTEINSSGSWDRTEIYAGGARLATYSGGSSGSTYFDHEDWLGTERARSNVSGTTCEMIASLPFGDGETTSGSCGDPSPLHFTAKERDSESGLDNFGARYNSSSLGRFLSPDDPKFSEKSDPQSWNLYSYVGGNPLTLTDPTGHNWFYLNGSWQWHPGDTYAWTGSDGNQQSAHSDYTDLIVYQETGKDGRTTRGTVTLYGNNGGFANSNIIAQDTIAFSGGAESRASVRLGNYEINLNLHGGVGTNRLVGTIETGTGLGAFHNGIQDVGTIDIGGGGTANFTGQWGTQRANLIPLQGQPSDQYLHGKDLYYKEGLSVTHGCIATPEQKVLGAIFKLDPSGVGEGAKTGRIAVSVQGIR